MKNNYKNISFFSLIINNFIIFLIIISNIQNLIISYYILPFKHFRNSLTSLYQIYKDVKREEIFLNYTNSISLFTQIKINDSLIFEAFFKSKEICSSISTKSCSNESLPDFKSPKNHKNTNISNIFDKIVEKSYIDLKNDKCINGIIGLGSSENFIISGCISFPSEVKKNDNTSKSYTWSIKYYNSNNDYDGEIIIGIEPHEYNPLIYNESNYIRIYNFANEETFDYPLYKENLEYSIKFDSIYFYNNSNISSENLIKNVGSSNMDGSFSLSNGMIQSSYEYYYNIKKNFFNKYIISNICEEIIFSRLYRTFVCDKNKLNYENFLKNFPTLYLKNIDLNYIFELTSKDLFIEEDNKLFFMIFINKLNSQKWSFGEIFLKKYYFTFNQDKKLIGFYIKSNSDENHENNNYNKDIKEKSYNGIIILIVGIGLLIIEAIVVIIWIWKKKCGIIRKKRANELIDDDYDYLPENSENKKIINDN